MKITDDHLRTLFRAAQRASIPPDTAPPSGFALRVAARWAQDATTQNPLMLWEHWCVRTAWGVALAMVLIVVTLWQRWTPAPETTDFTCDLAWISTGERP